MKKQQIPLFFLLLAIMLTSVFLIKDAHATTYYEWIDNGDFEEAVSQIFVNPSFETGDYTGWTKGGNTWVQEDGHTGTYSVNIGSSGSSNYWRQDFPSEPYLAQMEEFGFWIKLRGSCTSVGMRFIVQYTDATSDTVGVSCYTTEWEYKNLLPYIDLEKSVDYIKFYISSYGGTLNIACDDFTLAGEGGQDEINTTSEPWFGNMAGEETWLHVGVNVVSGHSGSCSMYIADESWSGWVAQQLSYYDTNFIHNASYWYASVDGTGKIQTTFVYSDGSESFDIQATEDDYTWRQVDISDAIVPNKLLTRIKFRIYDGEGGSQWTNIDDISILGTVEAEDATTFSYSVYPTPYFQSQIQFNAYQRQSYTFTGYVKNSSGLYEEDGNFTVAHSKGVTSGNMVNGVFSFTISARTNVNDFTERFTFVIMTEEDEVYNIQIDAFWKSVSPEDENYYDDSGGALMYTTYIMMFIFVFVPPFMLAVVIAQTESLQKINPFYGFFFGLILTTAISFQVGLMPLWFLFLMVICLVVMAIIIINTMRGNQS